MIDGKVSWWSPLPHLAGGRVWYDVVRSNNGILSSGVSWQSSNRLGGYKNLVFNGSSNIVATLSIASAVGYTFSFWVNRSNIGTVLDVTAGRFVIDFGTFATSGHLSTYDEGFGWRSYGALATNTWAHITFTCAKVGANGTLIAYLNGQQLGSSVTLHQFNFGGSVYFGSQNGSITYFSGFLDDFSVWARPLSSIEVMSNYIESQRGYPSLTPQFSEAVEEEEGLSVIPLAYNHRRRAG